MQGKGVPMRKGMLHRPRIDEMIREGLQYPLLIMLAGPGYGKTQAMASYFENSSDDILWVRLGNLDNQIGYFWRHMIRTLGDRYTEWADKLEAVSFPDSYSSFEAFVGILVRMIKKEQRMIWIFDDFGELTDTQIISFFRMMADAQIDNFYVVLLSNVMSGPDSAAFMSNKQYLILGEDLKFNSEEISELYALHQMTLTDSELEDIEHYTAGWPLPLHLLVLQKSKISDLVSQGGRLTYQIISNLFEERFFARYSENFKRLLVKLSLLTSFTKQLAYDLYDGEKIDLETFDNHAFLIFEPATDHFYFHQLYYMYLRQKQYLIEKEEARQMYQMAGDYYAALRDTMEAISCYRRCGNYVSMLKVIVEYIGQENDITAENAPYFMEHLDLLPDEVIREHPVAEHMRALVYMNLLQLDEAERRLQALEKKLLAEGTPAAHVLLAEVYAATGSIHLFKNQMDFGSYYQKAVRYHPEGSMFHNRNRLSTRNMNCFMLPDNQPGARERIERSMHDGMPWMSRFIHGSMSGREHVFSAEAAYLALEFSAARQHAYRGLYRAQAKAQHDLVCNCYVVLARIAFLEGDHDEMVRQIDNIVDLAGASDIGMLREIRDTALAWYYVRLHDDTRISKSTFAMIEESKPMWTYGRSQLVYANYLIHNREYARVVGMLESPKGMMMMPGVSPDRICLYIMLAVGYYHLGSAEAAADALYTACDMASHNGLAAPFVEAENHMIMLIEQIRRTQDQRFDREWLDLIHAETEAFLKRVVAIRAPYHLDKSAAAPDNPLSKRERKVLQALSQGMTREEIAHRQYISVNTVKSTIRNIYNKLNAGNRAEAVSIAITNGFIKCYSPDQGL